MICIEIPFVKPVKGKLGLLVIILEKGNLERMAVADPVQLSTEQFPMARHKRLEDLEVWICNEDPATLVEFQRCGDMQGLLKHLMRGWKVQDDDGMGAIPYRPPS